MSSEIQNLASFSITDSDKNTFSISLPSYPIILENSTNGNTVQVSGSQSFAQPDKGGLQKNIRVINLDGLLKIGSVNNNSSGVYSGAYPITFIYN